ncbi:hypothetical protein [Phenylobacterium sp.]|uniref:hypothetical protein n=1 Tax=Phenylobacterium sp. TaxID=1871053 RepID=UPI0035B1A98E
MAGERARWRTGLGVFLMVFGAALGFPFPVFLRGVFLPSRSGPAMAEFAWGHPAFLAGAGMLAAAVGLMAAGAAVLAWPGRRRDR